MNTRAVKGVRKGPEAKMTLQCSGSISTIELSDAGDPVGPN